MAKKKDKKYKYVVLENKELTSQTIGVINNKKSPIALILIFAIFIAVVFFLPDITEYVKNWKSTSIIPVNKKSDTKSDVITPEEPVETIQKYAVTTDLTIELTEMKLNNFVKADNQLSFLITNLLTTELNINDYAYYIELYDESKTLLERIKFENVNIAPSETFNYQIAIKETTYNTLTHISIIKITEADYPLVTLSKNDDGHEFLTCQNDYEKNIYFFTADKLFMIRKIVNLKNTVTDYETVYLKYSDYKNIYTDKDGYSVSFTNLQDGFLMSLTVDLKNVKELISGHYYYNLDTASKVVSFEMNSRGFTCS